MSPVGPDEEIATWDAEAAAFDEAADHGLRDPEVRAAWRELLVSLLPPAPARIADLGSGTGTLSLLLAEEGYAVDGVDFSAEMVRLARAKAAGQDEVTFVEADAADPPLTPARTTWCCADTSSGPCRIPRRARRWVGLLAPGGRLVLIEGQLVQRRRPAGRRDGRRWSRAPGGRRARRLPEAAYWGRRSTTSATSSCHHRVVE